MAMLALGMTMMPGMAGAADFIPFPPPPKNTMGEPDVAQTIVDRAKRAAIVVDFLACAKEIDFMGLLSDQTVSGEGLSAILMAKIAWLSRLESYDQQVLERAVCRNSIKLDRDKTPAEFLRDNGKQANQNAETRLGPSCKDFVTESRPFSEPVPGGPPRERIEITFAVKASCMREQVNKAIGTMVYPPKQLGTDGLPCITNLVDEVKITKEGDLDVEVRDMTRLFFLNEQAQRGAEQILRPGVRAKLNNDLLIINGPPGDAAYSVLGCGNTEHGKGTPREILDERDFLDEAADDFGDALSWLAKRLPVFLLLGGTPALLGLLGIGAAFPGQALAAAISVGIATVVVSTVNIPETENHRLMIESSRFLKNQIILKEEANHPNAGSLADDQRKLKEWLLAYMGEIMRQDFAEYNARPYQRYSLVSLLNLADFAEDGQVSGAAKMVLEFTLAKFALASREGIRVAPYRRLVEAMNQNPNMLEFGGRGTDHAIAMMLVYAGQSQRLPDKATGVPGEGDTVKALPYGTPSAMIYAASSRFAPDNGIVDLAIDKRTPYFQRIRHAGIEIYSSARSYTLAAGGINTPQQLSLQIGPIPTFSEPNDRGTGVPTSALLAGTKTVNRLGFMRFEGEIEDKGDKGQDGFGEKGRIYDHNTCVWRGFACGINYQEAEIVKVEDKPEENLAACFVPGLRGAPPEWKFLDSTTCAATKDAPPFFIARFLMPCTNKDAGCQDGGQFGFFEVVDAPRIRFDDFRQTVVATNRVVFFGNPAPSDAIRRPGIYRMSGRNESIMFSVISHKDNAKFSGIDRVNNQLHPPIPNWTLAEGDVLNSSGDGIVRFTNPNTKQSVIWDFSDSQNPKRTP
jgi:hypothetical protein